VAVKRFQRNVLRMIITLQFSDRAAFSELGVSFVCSVWASIAKWLWYRSGNQEVPGSIPSQVLLLFPLAKNFTHIALVYPDVEWGPGGLVSTGEATHPAVTSMGTWCKLGKQMPTVLVSLSSVKCEAIVEPRALQFLSVKPGQSSCEVLALPQEDLLHKAWVPEWYQASQCWFTGRQ